MTGWRWAAQNSIAVATQVPIDEYAVIDLDAPVVAAYEHRPKGGAVRFAFHCRHCDALHSHGAGEGHREAHCTNSASPFHATGYNLALAADGSRMVKSDGLGPL